MGLLHALPTCRGGLQCRPHHVSAMRCWGLQLRVLGFYYLNPQAKKKQPAESCQILVFIRGPALRSPPLRLCLLRCSFAWEVINEPRCMETTGMLSEH